MMVCNVKMTKDVAIGKNAGVVDDISVLRVFADGGMSLSKNVASGFQDGQFNAFVFRYLLHCFDVVGLTDKQILKLAHESEFFLLIVVLSPHLVAHVGHECLDENSGLDGQ